MAWRHISKIISVAGNTSFMLYPPLSRSTISFRCPVAKVFLAQKIVKLILLLIISRPKLYRKLEFQLGVVKFPLNFLRKIQISLQIFESPLARHAGCYYPVFEHSMLIFEVWGARAVRSVRKDFCNAFVVAINQHSGVILISSYYPY